ncbi:MAG: methyltransferase domain-containing protein [Gammaproteobacteria bacterium]|nr:methyltransferase domain-containing protein [Gammaproteobacteria bacterium]
MRQRHRIQFPKGSVRDLAQDEVYFYLVEGDRKRKIRFHDYGQIYLRPGLYEQMFYDRLQCASPAKVGSILQQTLAAASLPITELRVLDLGAGNGMMGEVVKRFGVSRLVGLDIIPEARDAAFRDRPGVYDEYYVADIAQADPELDEALHDWRFNCLTSVAALGFGDIPPQAFYNAVRLIQCGGWVAFNIKETFLDNADTSGFSRFIRELIFSEYLDLYHLEKYRHRYSIDGQPLFYFALAARKAHDIPPEIASSCGIGD